MTENKTCKTCKDNDNGLCDRTGQLIDDDDHCDSWHSDWRDAIMANGLRDIITKCLKQPIVLKRTMNGIQYKDITIFYKRE